MVFRHEAMGGGLHQFKFPSRSRRGVTHILSLDLAATRAEERLLCTCEGALFTRFCKHARWILTGRVSA